MTVLVPLALFGWPIVVLMLFARFAATRAAILSLLLAWMFLPATGYVLPGLPDYSKTTAAVVSVLLATLAFEPHRLFSWRPSALDLPMFVWCLCPFASSIVNGLGAYDGMSAAAEKTMSWGLPYILGRAYLRNIPDLREVAFLLFIGGLIYIPLCVFEMRMSPQLNQWIYGFGGSGVAYKELGSWGSRPLVFMKDGLTLGMFMTAASLCGFYLWFAGGLKRIWGYSAGWLVVALIFTSVMCKNMGASVLLVAGLGCLVSIRYVKSPWAVYLLIAAAPLYMLLRGTGRMGGDAIVNVVSSIHERRAESLQTRLDNENRLVDKAMQQPVFGWGGWGRWWVYDEDGRGITLPDGLWVIALCSSGLIGLSAITASLLLPAAAFVVRYPARNWVYPAIAPGGALAVLLCLYAVDCLMNAMLNPIYMMIAGGLTGATFAQRVDPHNARRAVAATVAALPRPAHFRAFVQASDS